MVEEPQAVTTHTEADTIMTQKKFSVIRILILLISLFFIAIAVCEALGWPFLRAPVEQFASKQLDRTVRINAPFHLKLLGGVELNVAGLYISAPKTFDATHFIETNNIVLNLRYSDLFTFKNTNQLRIKSLRVNQIDAQLLRKVDGSATWQFSDDENKPDSPFPIFETLMVQSGSAKIVDPENQLDLAAKFYTNEGAAHTNIVSNKEIALSKNEMVLNKEVALNQVDLNKNVSPNQPVTSKNSVASGIEIQGKFSKKAIKGKLTTDGFLPIATHDKNSAPIASTAWVEFGGLRADFVGTVSDLFGKHDVKGKLSVKGPSLAVLGKLVNVVLPTTDKFSLSTMLEKDDQVWIAKSVNSHVGNSDLNGNFTYDPRPIRPLLKGNFGGKRFYLADLAPAFGTKNADGSIATPDNGKALPDRPLDLPSLNKMDAQIEVNLAYVDLGNAFSRPISPLKADLVLDNGKLSLSKIDARTADGSISGLISIDTHLANVADKSVLNKGAINKDEASKSAPEKTLTTSDNDKVALAAVKNVPPTWNINLRWKDIDVEKWLTVSTDPKKQAAADGKKETPPSYVTGTLNGKTKLTGRGNSTAEMLSSLDGDVSIFMQKGTISHLIVEAVGLDIAQALGILLTKDNALPMNCAVMDLTAKNGIATPKIALIDTPVTLILIDGNVNIAKESLDLRMAAKPKNTSPFTVRSPIHVTGSFKKPDVSIEKTPIVARVLGSIALAFVAPPAAILPFIDVGSGDESPCNKSLKEFNDKL